MTELFGYSPSKLYPEYWIRLMFCILYVYWIQYSPDILFSICAVDITFILSSCIQNIICILSIYRMLPVSFLYPGYYLSPICIQNIICILPIYRILSVSYLYPICILSVSYLYPGYYLYPICIVSLGINSNPDWPLCHEFTKMSHCVVHRVLEHRQNFL